MRLRSLLVGLALALPASLGAQALSFSGSITNPGVTPQVFAFGFFNPVPLGSFTGVSLDFSAMLFLETAFTGVAAPAGPGGFVLSAYGSLAGGSPFLLGQYGVEPCIATIATPIVNCPYMPTGGVNLAFGSPVMLDMLEARVEFVLDGGTRYDFNGQVALSTAPPPTAIPEPATVALLGTGLLVLGGAAAARRRSRT